jgi:amidase
MDPTFATATELTDALRRRAISSRELLEVTLQRIEAAAPHLNAVVRLDVDRARQEATHADEALAGGDLLGPLHGLPMTVKDVWGTEGLVTTSGAPGRARFVPERDAPAVARLRAAGAIVVGKTNTPLWAGDIQTVNDVYGRTSNPWDLARTPGGSSGGAAAAVAAGLSPLELGSDIGGSIRTPAHCCGVYGLKPSWGVIPTRGYLPPTGDLIEDDVNVAGPLARSIDDLELALGVLAGPNDDEAVAWRLELPAGPPVEELAGLRVGVTLDDSDFPVSGEVRDVLQRLADRVADAGAQVVEVPLPVDLGDGFRTWIDLVLPIVGALLPDEEFAAFCGLDGIVDESLGVRAGQALVSRWRTRREADERRQHQRRRWAELFDDHDVVLAPPMVVPAFPHDHERPFAERTLDYDGHSAEHLELTAWCAAIGVMLLPVVCLPAGRTRDGLPVGVQCIGPFLSDRRLVGIARLLDTTGERFVPPPLAFLEEGRGGPPPFL